MRTYIFRLIAAALLLTVAVSSVNAGGFTATIWQLDWSPDGQSLLYSLYNKGVFIVNLDGESHQILDADSVDWFPDWSPDGKFLISTIEVDDQEGIFLTPLMGGESQRLTEDVGWRPNYYAPNGTLPRYSP